MSPGSSARTTAAARAGVTVGRVRQLIATIAGDRDQGRLDAGLVAALTVAGELEVLLAGADGGRLVSAVAIAVVTVSLLTRRRAPLLTLAAIAAALLGDAALGGSLVGDVATPLVALAIALYSAGRHLAGARGLAGAAVMIAALVATRIAFDPAVQGLADGVLTLVYVPVPLLVGRWVRGQVVLQAELEQKIEQLDRERERDARQAAEEERVRIASDLQEAVAGGLGAIVEQARLLPPSLRAAEDERSRAAFASIAFTAREALADVRRVLGILRREGEAPRLDPPSADSGALSDVAGTDRPVAREQATDGARVPGVMPEAHAPGVKARGRQRFAALSRLDPRRLDGLLVVILLAGAELELALQAPADMRAFAALSAGLIAAPLLWRRRRPLLVVAAVLCAVGIQSAVLRLDTFPVLDIAALVCATYAIGAHARDRRPAIAGLVLAALGAAGHAAVFYPDGVVPALLGGVAIPWIVGRIVRGRRRLTAEMQGRARRDEHARQQEARAAMTAERMRVARELHDAVAHSISVIAIQAGGAEALVDRDRERAAQCAALIEQTGGEALAEFGRLLNPLRLQAEAEAGGDAAAPQPSLARVQTLTERARDAGLLVDLRIEGTPAALPAGVDLAAYRIVQEALANTHKHAGRARARVVVRYERRAVEVEIGDDGHGPNAQPATDGGGHGLVGMRERVALYGGTLVVGEHPGGGFKVHARLPIGRR